MAKKRYKYSFTKKRHTRGGVESSILALMSGLLFFGAAICSLVMSGQGGMYLGAMGILALGLSVYGFILGAEKLFGTEPCISLQQDRFRGQRRADGHLDCAFFGGNLIRRKYGR